MATTAVHNPQATTAPVIAAAPATAPTRCGSCWNLAQETLLNIVRMSREKPKYVIKAVGYFFGWQNVADPSNTYAKGMSGFCRNTKNALSMTEVPHNALETFRALRSFWNEHSVTNGRQVVAKGQPLVNSVCDSLKLTNQLGATNLNGTGIDKVNFTACLIGSSHGSYSAVEKIVQRTDNRSVQAYYLANLARDISYVALAVIGLHAIFIAGVAAAPWVMLACLTSAQFFTIVGYLTERYFEHPTRGINYRSAQPVNL